MVGLVIIVGVLRLWEPGNSRTKRQSVARIYLIHSV